MNASGMFRTIQLPIFESHGLASERDLAGKTGKATRMEESITDG